MDHLDLADEDFASQFKNCKLDPILFNHEAHLRLAWIYINKFGVTEATELVCKQLLDYVDHLSAKDTFNKTLTVAAIRAVDHFNKKLPLATFVEFINTHPQLKSDFKKLIASHYKTDIFNSPLAKRVYVEPDLVPFD